jgi:carbon-monoxide dehydrogenase medium subunit
VKPAPFVYHAPETLSAALDLMATLDNARPLAGGQSLMPMMNFRVATPDHLIDLGRVADLVGIEIVGDRLRIGAMTTQRALEKSALARGACPLLAEAIDHVGHQQTRNRGTLGGSLCHMDPGAELPVAAMALGAELIVASARGTRALSFSDFPVGYLTTALEADEILTRVDLPLAGPREGWAFIEFNRRPADFAIVSVAVRLSLDGNEKIEQVSIALGGVRPTPLKAIEVEDLLRGEAPNAATIARAAAAIATLDCEGDDLYPADYRRDICETLTRRALMRAVERAKGRGHG